MIKNQKGNIQVLILLLIVIAIVAAVYLVQQKTNFFPKATTNHPQNQPVAIQNDNDLIKTQTELDNINLDSLNNDLEQNSNDLANF